MVEKNTLAEVTREKERSGKRRAVVVLVVVPPAVWAFLEELVSGYETVVSYLLNIVGM